MPPLSYLFNEHKEWASFRLALNKFVWMETGEGTSTWVRAEEKARQRPESSFPRGLERVVSRYSILYQLRIHLLTPVDLRLRFATETYLTESVS